MRRFCFLFLSAWAFVACGAFKPFTFVQMSDPQIGFMDRSAGYIQSDTLMQKAVTAVNALDPACVIVTGDLVNDSYNVAQDSIYRVRIAEVKAPVYVIPGNHDIQGFDVEKHRHYVDWRGYDRFSFKDRKCAFIGFDTNSIKDGAADFEAAQLEWLKGELAAAKGSKYIFVFVHCPVIKESIDEKEDSENFPMARRKEYVDLFKQYGVAAVFSGHTHRDLSCEYDGIRFYTAGPVGAALGQSKPGYHVIRVTADGFTVEYVPTPGVEWRGFGFGRRRPGPPPARP